MSSPRVSISSSSSLSRNAGSDNNNNSHSTIITSPVDDSRRNRRNALKEFYNLKKQQQNSSNNHNNSSGEVSSKQDAVMKFLNSLSNESEGNHSKLKEFLKDCSCSDLVKLENEIHTNVSSSNSMTKNIIYDNYSDLIKINDVLKEMSISENVLKKETIKGEEEEEENDTSGGDNSDEEDKIQKENELSGGMKKLQLEQLGIRFLDYPNKLKTNKRQSMKEKMDVLNKQVKKFNKLNNRVNNINFIDV